MVKSVEYVVGKTRKQIDHEPGLQVVESDHFGIGDNFAAGSNVGGMKVEYNVNKKDDVYDGVYHKEWNVFWGFIFQRHIVGNHDGGVEGETKNDPVPNGLEGAIM